MGSSGNSNDYFQSELCAVPPLSYPPSIQLTVTIDYGYAISRYVPVQFDSQGVTVWIPSQVESTVGLIGASLPAVHQMLRHRFASYGEKVSSLTDDQWMWRASRTFGGSKRTPIGSGQQDGNESAVELRSNMKGDRY